MKKEQAEKKEDITLSIEYKKPKLFWRILLAIFLIFFISVTITTVVAYRKVKKYQQQFLLGAKIDSADFKKTIDTLNTDFAFLSENPDQAIKQKNLLIFGVDQVEGRNGGALLTDTILLIQLDSLNNQIKSVALPRDLYHPDYKTKINALYFYGIEKDPNNSLAFPTQAISELIDLNIDHTLVIKIETLENLIDLVGGVEITIQESFTDPLFPREGVDVTVATDPAVLYETVIFSKGQETMNGNRALQYMRSRNSGDDQGNDLARGQRQQAVLQALLEKIVDFEFIINQPEKMGQLYRFYLDNFANSLSVNELAKTMISWLIIQQNNEKIFNPSFTTFTIPVYPENNQGLIVHPPLWQSQQQWIYQIRDLTVFQKTLQDFFIKGQTN